jgi:hypothetical protein
MMAHLTASTLAAGAGGSAAPVMAHLVESGKPSLAEARAAEALAQRQKSS